MTTFPVWAGFTALIVGLLVFACGSREVSFRRATILSLLWIVLAFLFGVVVFALAGQRGGATRLGGGVVVVVGESREETQGLC